jgi:DNA-binding NtrC family response regulator
MAWRPWSWRMSATGQVPWILITGHGNEETAVAAIKQGAFNYLTKPVDLARLKATIESAVRLAAANRENKALRRELGYDEALDRIVGTSTWRSATSRR